MSSAEDFRMLSALSSIWQRAPAWQQLAELPADELVQVAQRHRMVAFARKQFEAAAVPAALEACRLTFEGKHAENVANARKRTTELYRLIDDMPALDRTIVVKGNRDFLLTGDEDLIKQSFDFDFLVTDIAQCMREFEADPSVIQAPRAPSAHEFINFDRNGVPFDGHNWFPTCIPENADAEGIPASVSFGAISYDELLPHCDACRSPSGRTFFLPNVSLAAVLEIAAAYRDYVIAGFPIMQGRPPVRLGHILLIDHFMGRREFRIEEFLTLAERHLGRDVLRWYRHTAAILNLASAAPESALAQLEPPSGTPASAHCNLYHRHWFRRGPFDLEAVGAQLSGQQMQQCVADVTMRLPITVDGSWSGAAPELSTATATRYGTDRGPRVELKATSSALQLRVHTNWVDQGSSRRVLVRIQDSLYHLYFPHGGKQSWMKAPTAKYELQPAELGQEIIDVDFEMPGQEMERVTFICVATAEYFGNPDTPEYVTVTPKTLDWTHRPMP